MVKSSNLPDRVGAGATEGCGTPPALGPPTHASDFTCTITAFIGT